MENKKSSNKSFGIVFSFFFALIILYKFFKYGVIDLKLIFICVVFLTFTYIYPAIFSPLNKLWIKFGDLLGLIVPPIVMFVIYFTVILITSIILKIFRKDILDLNINNDAKTFWRSKDTKTGNMSKQF